MLNLSQQAVVYFGRSRGKTASRTETGKKIKAGSLIKIIFCVTQTSSDDITDTQWIVLISRSTEILHANPRGF